jgi:hypothetical protein
VCRAADEAILVHYQWHSFSVDPVHVRFTFPYSRGDLEPLALSR